VIRIFPNRLDAQAIETHRIDTRTTLADFLNNVMSAGYTAGEHLALSAWVNDEKIPLSDWGNFVILPKDDVRLHIEPKGTDPFSITLALFAGVQAVFNALMPKLPGTPNTPGQGDQLEGQDGRPGVRDIRSPQGVPQLLGSTA
jgi:hypothetical protein